MKKLNEWRESQSPLFDDIEHTVGNPLFAIETNLEPLRKRIREGRIEEALEIVQEIEASVNKAKIGLLNRKQ